MERAEYEWGDGADEDGERDGERGRCAWSVVRMCAGRLPHHRHHRPRFSPYPVPCTALNRHLNFNALLTHGPTAALSILAWNRRALVGMNVRRLLIFIAYDGCSAWVQGNTRGVMVRFPFPSPLFFRPVTAVHADSTLTTVFAAVPQGRTDGARDAQQRAALSFA